MTFVVGCCVNRISRLVGATWSSSGLIILVFRLFCLGNRSDRPFSCRALRSLCTRNNNFRYFLTFSSITFSRILLIIIILSDQRSLVLHLIISTNEDTNQKEYILLQRPTSTVINVGFTILHVWYCVNIT